MSQPASESTGGSASSDSGSGENHWSADSERLRDLTKWIIASFGAVAVTLVAGSQLSDVGRLESGPRLTAALVGLVLGLVGTLVAVVTSARVIAAGGISLLELSGPAPLPPSGRFGRARAFVTPPYGRGRSMRRVRQVTDQTFGMYGGDLGRIGDLAGELRTRYERYLELRTYVISVEAALADRRASETLDEQVSWSDGDDRDRVLRALGGAATAGPDPAAGTTNPQLGTTATAPPVSPLVRAAARRVHAVADRLCGHPAAAPPAATGSLPADERASLLAAVNEVYGNAKKEFERIQDYANVVVRFASNELVRQEFRRSMKFLVAAAVVAAIGIGLFAWAAHPPGATSPSPPAGGAVGSISADREATVIPRAAMIPNPA